MIELWYPQVNIQLKPDLATWLHIIPFFKYYQRMGEPNSQVGEGKGPFKWHLNY